MASVTFKYSGTSKTVNVFKLDVIRQSVRAKYRYINGGTGSYYIACRLTWRFKWEHLSTTDYEAMATVFDWIRQGYDVYIYSVSGFSYLNAGAIPASPGLKIDLESDDILEQEFELFEKMPMEVIFITRDARGLVHTG